MNGYVLLDLFCGAGGASHGYHLAGFAVTGVDLSPQPNYPYGFIHADALDVLDPRSEWAPLVANVDVIHASPPCQTWTAYRRRGGGVGEDYEDLIAVTRKALRATGLPYVIENIPTAPLENPMQMCGSSFGLDVRRHRHFESNVPLVAPPCNHEWQTARFPPATNRQNLRRSVEVGAYRCAAFAPDAMGIHWMNNSEISEAIPPAYTQFIGRQIAAWLRARHQVPEDAE